MTPSSTLNGSSRVAKAATRAHRVVDDTAERAAPAVEHALAAAHATIDTLATTAEAANEFASEGRRTLTTRSQAMAERCGNYVRAKPFVALAGALAIGYVAGRLLR
jgi:ElaB/YqjD/DUF883 family membrane-anchored ribosome-binding protein